MSYFTPAALISNTDIETSTCELAENKFRLGIEKRLQTTGE